MSLRILIDLQGAQNLSKHRGIGRYSLALADGIARHAKDHEILILLNGLFRNSIDDVKASLSNVIPARNFLVFSVPGPVAESGPANIWRRRSAELLREYTIETLAPDALLVSSMIEGEADDTVTSVKSLPSRVVTTAIVYDLIPLMNPEEYLSQDRVKHWYFGKLDSLRRADHFLAISNSAKNEACAHLNINPLHIDNISSAASAIFFTKPDMRKVSEIVKGFGVSRKYLMHMGAPDKRKNFEGLIRAFALLPIEVRIEYQLVFVCGANAADKARLLRLALDSGLTPQDLLLISYATDEQLVALYINCYLFVYPSFHEGFGLPPLEAMSCGAPAIGSNASSIPEVIGREDALFDPSSDISISKLILRALTDQAFYHSLRNHAGVQSAKFSWDGTARRAISGIEKSILQRREPAPIVSLKQTRGRFMDLLAKLAIQHSPSNFEILELARCIAKNDVEARRLDLPPLHLEP